MRNRSSGRSSRYGCSREGREGCGGFGAAALPHSVPDGIPVPLRHPADNFSMPFIMVARPTASAEITVLGRLHQLVFAHFHGAAMAVGESDPIVPDRMDGHG